MELEDRETTEFEDNVDSNDDVISYTCNICAAQFPTKNDFLEHHFNQYGQTFSCCKCGNKFATTGELYAHLETHATFVEGEEEVVEEIVLNYETSTEEGTTEDLMYYQIQDCPDTDASEIVIEGEVPMIQKRVKQRTNLGNIVQLEHGYVIPNAAPEQEKTLIVFNGKQKVIASTSKLSTSTPINPRPRALPLKRRHVVPDFSSTNYLYVQPNEDVEIAHYKCLRCEQLFLNKYVFFRHIEKGKCYINNCDVCNETFTKNSDFMRHYVSEHTDRAICNFCFRTFMYEKNVKEHMLRHLDQFRHRCDECNKGFYTVREYRNHYKNRHMGIRHNCNVCSRSFADEYYFRRHLATHQPNSNEISLE